MARGNEYEAEWTVSQLDLQPTDRVLEIGFGAGVAIQLASQKVTNGQVIGIDLSDTMLQLARQRNALAIQAGRVQLDQGDGLNLPYAPTPLIKLSPFTLQLISKRELGNSQAAKRVLNSPISPEQRLFEMSCSNNHAPESQMAAASSLQRIHHIQHR